MESVEGMENNQVIDHDYAKKNIDSERLLPDHLKDHNYCTKTDNSLLLDMQYADDMGWASNQKNRIEDIKESFKDFKEEKYACE